MSQRAFRRALLGRNWNSEIQSMLPLSASTLAIRLGKRKTDVLAELHELEAQGRVCRRGQGRAARWCLVPAETKPHVQAPVPRPQLQDSGSSPRTAPDIPIRSEQPAPIAEQRKSAREQREAEEARKAADLEQRVQTLMANARAERYGAWRPLPDSMRAGAPPSRPRWS